MRKKNILKETPAKFWRFYSMWINIWLHLFSDAFSVVSPAITSPHVYTRPGSLVIRKRPISCEYAPSYCNITGGTGTPSPAPRDHPLDDSLNLSAGWFAESVDNIVVEPEYTVPCGSAPQSVVGQLVRESSRVLEGGSTDDATDPSESTQRANDCASWFHWLTLKTKDRQFNNFVVTGGTASCHYSYLRCRQWRPSSQIDDLLILMQDYENGSHNNSNYEILTGSL